MARIEIADHFEITLRGSFVACHIVDGVIKKGMKLETNHADLPRLTISDIDYLDIVNTGEVWIALRFRERPSLDLLKELLPLNSTISLRE